MQSAQTDDQLMAAMKNGDITAFNELFERHRRAVFGYCMRLFSGERASAEDISQEVWLKVLNNAATYEPRGQFKAWLMTVTRNQAMSRFRSKAVFSEEGESAGEELADQFDLEADFLKRHDSAQLRKALDSLIDPQRLALTLWMVEELSGEQIAEVMGITVVAVKSHLVRGKRNLRKTLGEDV